MVLRLCFIFALLSLGCSNPNERDNPTDYIHVYSVTFNASEATGGTPPAAMTGSYGDVIQLPDGGDLERDGYVVGWWQTDSGRDVVGSNYTITGNVAMNAGWNPVYTVTFDGNGATSGTPPAAMKVIRDAATPLPYQGTLERTGYVFDGWNTNSSGIGTSYNAGSYNTIASNITLYAKWLRVYTVTFDGNGATSGTAPMTMKIDSGAAAIQLPDKGTLQRTNYIFTGWNINSSGDGNNASSPRRIVNDITFYAVWTPCFGTHYCDMRDGQIYKITTIGTQVWFAENLNYNATGSKCYNNLESFCDRDGRLYNWATAMNNSASSTAVPSGVRGICPEGWHLPSEAEWNVMTTYIGGYATEGKKLKATSGWNDNGNGTDEYDFSALPGGNSNGGFYDIGESGVWWSTSEYSSSNAYSRHMGYDIDYATWSTSYKSILYSIRCLQDYSSSSVPSSSSSSIVLPDSRDGKTYKAVVIGNQTWMAENLNYNATGSKCYGDDTGGDSQGNCVKYGRLYDWSTVMNGAASSTAVPSGVRGVCPEGWHLPSKAEWEVMTAYTGAWLGNNNTEAKILKATTGWNTSGITTPGTDEYGFSALPGGLGGGDGSWWNVGNQGQWWVTEGSTRLMGTGESAYWAGINDGNLYSVRCLKD